MTKTGKTYGGALYDLAAEEQLTTEIFEEIKAVEQIFRDNPDYMKLLREPSVPKAERKSLMDGAWKDNVHPYLLNFMKLLCDNDTLGEFSECAKEYQERYYEDNGIIEVEAVCASELRDNLRERLKNKLEKKTGKQIILNVVVDPSLLGGMRLNLQGQEYDGSVRHHLDEIQKLLKSASF